MTIDETGRIVAKAAESDVEANIESSLRPQSFKNFIGQKKVTNHLSVYIEAAKKRDEALDHCLFAGPPGLGKTTLAYLVARELGSHFYTLSGPALDKKGDLAAILTNLQPFDVVFIDEIHRMPTAVEEVLYSAMEDFRLDLVIGQGPGARAMQVQLPPFTLIGATTRAGLLTTPLRDRFGISMQMQFYQPPELQTIVTQAAAVLNAQIEPEGALEIACRSRGTPRIANRLLRRVRDFAQVKSDGVISKALSEEALESLEVDRRGLDAMDKKILKTIADFFSGGPVGIDALAASIGEESQTIEDVYEPYLLQEGFLQRTSRGRIATQQTYDHLGLKQPRPAGSGASSGTSGASEESAANSQANLPLNY